MVATASCPEDICCCSPPPWAPGHCIVAATPKGGCACGGGFCGEAQAPRSKACKKPRGPLKLHCRPQPAGASLERRVLSRKPPCGKGLKGGFGDGERTECSVCILDACGSCGCWPNCFCESWRGTGSGSGGRRGGTGGEALEIRTSDLAMLCRTSPASSRSISESNGFRDSFALGAASPAGSLRSAGGSRSGGGGGGGGGGPESCTVAGGASAPSPQTTQRLWVPEQAGHNSKLVYEV
mmetsp:Transcript_124131/g.356535  ORF Transcript_124131/g.356535 Transcript_124131/m.356535 type:complete len:238 (-) Transcript_124131:971-1684(-)